MATNTGMSFSFSQGTNGGANRFGFDGDSFFISGQGVRGRPKFDDFDDFLVVAANVFDGDVERRGTINDAALATGAGPNSLRVNDNDEAIIGGRSVGGSYRIQFDETEDANNFLDFVERFLAEIDANDVIATDPTQFSFAAAGASGSGATRIAFDDSTDQFLFAGSGVSGQQRFNSLEVFVEGIADLYGGFQERDGTFDAQRAADGAGPNSIRVTGDNDVVVGGRGVGGQFRFQFDNEETARVVAGIYDDLFDNIAEASTIAINDMPFV